MSHYTIAPLAREDLQSIWDYIGIQNDSPVAATHLLEKFHETFALLGARPLLGQLREDLRLRLRTFVVGSYVVLYYPLRDGIEVVGVVHGARDIESMFQSGQRRATNGVAGLNPTAYNDLSPGRRKPGTSRPQKRPDQRYGRFGNRGRSMIPTLSKIVDCRKHRTTAANRRG